MDFEAGGGVADHGAARVRKQLQRHPDVAGLILESAIADPLERVLMRIQPAEIGATLAELEEEAQQYLDHRAKVTAYPGGACDLDRRTFRHIGCRIFRPLRNPS